MGEKPYFRVDLAAIGLEAHLQLTVILSQNFLGRRRSGPCL